MYNWSREQGCICITQGINKDCLPTCWFVSLGFTNRVSKDHRGKVENITLWVQNVSPMSHVDMQWMKMFC